MNKKIATLSAIIIIVIIFIAYSMLFAQLGPGTADEFRPVDGCNLVSGIDYEPSITRNISLDDEALDGVIIEWGFRARGYERTSLREYCATHEYWNDYPLDSCVNAVFRNVWICCENPEQDICKPL